MEHLSQFTIKRTYSKDTNKFLEKRNSAANVVVWLVTWIFG